MALKACIFAQTTGDPVTVARKIRNVAGITEATPLFGSVPIVAMAKATNLATLHRLVMKIKKIRGVADTDTRLAVQ